MYNKIINKAIDYIITNLKISDDVYTLALASYALQLANHTSKDTILQSFDKKATLDGLKYLISLSF